MHIPVAILSLFTTKGCWLLIVLASSKKSRATILLLPFLQKRKLIKKIQSQTNLEIYEAGDCVQPRRNFEAMREGHIAARQRTMTSIGCCSIIFEEIQGFSHSQSASSNSATRIFRSSWKTISLRYIRPRALSSIGKKSEIVIYAKHNMFRGDGVYSCLRLLEWCFKIGLLGAFFFTCSVPVTRPADSCTNLYGQIFKLYVILLFSWRRNGSD